MKTASEFLREQPPSPLSAALSVRPLRLLTLVPEFEPFSWQRIFSHALAAQGRAWGGYGNILLPFSRPLREDELFWKLAEAFDPDGIGLFAPTFADLEVLDPDAYAAERARWLQGWDDPAHQQMIIDDARDQLMYELELGAELQAEVLTRLAPLHFEEQPNVYYVNGVSAPQYPSTDITNFRHIPSPIQNVVTALGDVQQLMLTARWGQFLPAVVQVLNERGIEVEERRIDAELEWLPYAIPREPIDGIFPKAVSGAGLAWRLHLGDRGRVVLVVGGGIWDFCLYFALAQMRMHVFWLPNDYLEAPLFIFRLGSALGGYARSMGGGNQVAIVSAESEGLRDRAREAIGDAALLRGVNLELLHWQEVVPRSPMRQLERNNVGRPQALLRNEGETHQLPTPIPRGVRTETPTDVRWMVDVEVDGWAPIRNPRLAGAVVRRPFGNGHDARVSRSGPSYLGISPIVQAGDSLESAASRPRLGPLPILEQLRVVLEPAGWTFAPSDKGAYAHQSALLMGGAQGLVETLRDPATRRVLDAFLVPRETDGVGLFVDERGRRFLSYMDIQILAGDAAADVLANLTEKGVLQRGHVLKCEHCRGTSFYTLGHDQRFRCFRCYSDQEATPFSWLGTPEPAFRYGIAEVVFQFLRANGELPLCAIFDHLVTARSGRVDRPLDIAHELEFRPPSPRRAREHDIVASWGTELWLGEATITDRFGTAAEETSRFNRIAETAAATGAHGVMLVSSAPEFRASTITRARSAFRSPVWPELRFISNVQTT